MKLHQLDKATVTVEQIKTTEEYKARTSSCAESHLVAGCILYLRGDFANLDEAITQAQRQMQVAHTGKRELIDKTTTMIWQPSGPTSKPNTNNDFVKLIRGTGGVNLRSGACHMNCWEAVITMAMLDLQLTNPQRLNGIYESSPKTFTAELVHAFTGTQRLYQPQYLLGTPIAGDIVLFDGLDHVALATGRVTGGPAQLPTVPGNNVISFWPAPAQNNFSGGTPTTVTETTIESLTTWGSTNANTAFKVTFGCPDWQALS